MRPNLYLHLVYLEISYLFRFGSELVFSLCELYGVEVVILNKDPDSSPEEELAKDVLEIITVFSAKLHSMRSRKNVAILQENLKKLADLDQKILLHLSLKSRQGRQGRQGGQGGNAYFFVHMIATTRGFVKNLPLRGTSRWVASAF